MGQTTSFPQIHGPSSRIPGIIIRRLPGQHSNKRLVNFFFSFIILFFVDYPYSFRKIATSVEFSRLISQGIQLKSKLNMFQP